MRERCDFDFVLTDADRFDDDRVVAHRVHHERGVVASTRASAAELAARCHRADEDVGVGGVTLHAHAVAEYCAARERAARIDADHAYLAFAAPELADERIDECRLAGTRRPGDTNQVRAPGVREEFPEQGAAARLTVLEPADQSRTGRDIASQDAPSRAHASCSLHHLRM